jgi:dihydrodipicolinate synthase/N-acetylneuraminate lyase
LFTQTKANILVYNNPFLFKASIPALWLDNVINWEKLVGFIDASRNEDYIDELGKYSQLTKLFEENEDFAFVSLRRGFSGLCCLASLLFPSYYTNLIENFSEFDFKKMVRYEARVSALSKLLSPEKKVQAFKYALSLHGLIQPFSFEKYGELSEKERFLIEEEFSPRKVSRKVA